METEMGYRGSKSEFQTPQPKEIFVKEQRVDGSYFGLNPKLRCTLTGFERNYLIKIPSKQLNKKFYSTLNYKPKLNPWFITGFTDAEGCFSISVKTDSKLKLKWRVSPLFIIKLHSKDTAILEAIKNTLGVGKIRQNGINSAQYIVETFIDLKVIVDHFDKYPLITVKLSDYLIFKACFNIIKQKEHLTEKGLFKIVSLKSSLNWGLSDKLIKAFPNIVTEYKPEYTFKCIPDPFWVAGFTSGDGSFFLRIKARTMKKGLRVSLVYSINLNIREKKVIIGLANFFNFNVTKVSNKSTGLVTTKVQYKYIYICKDKISFQITKMSDIINTIIPFFEKYPIVGIKSLDFADFKKVCDMVKNKEHLTPEGSKKILQIKSRMNQNRAY